MHARACGDLLADGHPVALLFNIKDAAGAAAVAKVDAEGVGLFRTKFVHRPAG